MNIPAKSTVLQQTFIDDYEITTHWSGLEFIVSIIRERYDSFFIYRPRAQVFHRAMKCEVDAIRLHNKLIFLIDQQLYSEIANV